MTAIFNSIMSKLAHSHFYSRTQAISQQREGWFYFVVGSMVVYSLTYTMDLWNWIFNVLPVAAVRTTKWRSQCNDGLKHFCSSIDFYDEHKYYIHFSTNAEVFYTLCVLYDDGNGLLEYILVRNVKSKKCIRAGNKKKTNEENPLEGRQRHNLH